MKSILSRMAYVGLLPIALVLIAGCGADQIDGTYGKRRGSPGADSVNGTGVLADMFKQSGFKVGTRRHLSPGIEEFDVIVWAPDDFAEPSAEVRDFLENWLAQGENRTLVYIGRDYDAEVAYWEQWRNTAPPQQTVEVLRRLARARAAHAKRRGEMPEGLKSAWFTMRRDSVIKRMGSEPGSAIRSAGVWGQDEQFGASDLAIEIHGRLNPPPQRSRSTRGGRYTGETLLAMDGEVLVYRLSNRDWPSGQIIVVENGSFLLNLPLVWKGHRKLAGKLIADCGTPSKVAFLESTPDSLIVFDSEPGSNSPTGLEAFTVWPLGAILWHLLAAGVLYLFARLMIFGRPQELPPEESSDFGRHVQAMGEMLASTGDQNYARGLLLEYQEKVKHDAKTGSQQKKKGG